MKKRHGVLALLVTLSVITFLDRLAIAVAGPRIQDELHIPPERWGWVLGAFALAYGLFEMPSGAAGDRRGRRSILSRIVVWWSLFTAATAAATSFLQLTVIQFLFGAGEAGAYPNASGIIARWFPRAERGRAQGAVWAASRLGGALSPLLVIPLLNSIGWRAMFCLLASLGLAWAAVFRSWFHDDPATQPGIAPSELAELEPPPTSSHSASVWRPLLRSRQTWLLASMYFCYVWGSWFYFSWFPTFLVRGAGFSETEMGLLSMLPFALGCCGNLAGGYLSDRLSARFGLKLGRCGQASSALAVSSLLICALAFTTDKTLIVLFAALGFGVLDLMLPAAWATTLDLGRQHAGLLGGAMNSAGLAGGFTCTVLFGYLVRSTGGYRAPLCLIAAMVLLSAFLFLFIDPRQRVWPEDDAS